MSEKDGGAAFPQAYAKLSGDDHGMTLRDYFAAQIAGPLAVVMLTAHAATGEGGEETRRLVSAMAYEFADGMLEARKR